MVKKQPMAARWACMALACGLAAPAMAGVDFVRLVGTDSTIPAGGANFTMIEHGRMSVDDSDVYFVDEDTNGDRGIFRIHSNGTIETIVDSSTLLTGTSLSGTFNFAASLQARDGTLAFHGLTTGGEGIFKVSGGTIETIAETGSIAVRPDASTETISFDLNRQVSTSNGNVAFVAIGSVSGEALYYHDGSTLRLAEPLGSRRGTDPWLVGDQLVHLSYPGFGNPDSILQRDVGTLSDEVIVDGTTLIQPDNIPLAQFHDLSVRGDTLAFAGRLDGGEDSLFVRAAADQPIVRVISEGYTVEMSDGPKVVDFVNRISAGADGFTAFVASVDENSHLLLRANSPTSLPIPALSVGDELDGKLIGSIDLLGRDAYNGNSGVVRVGLSDGEVALYRFTRNLLPDSGVVASTFRTVDGVLVESSFDVDAIDAQTALEAQYGAADHEFVKADAHGFINTFLSAPTVKSSSYIGARDGSAPVNTHEELKTITEVIAYFRPIGTDPAAPIDLDIALSIGGQLNVLNEFGNEAGVSVWASVHTATEEADVFTGVAELSGDPNTDAGELTVTGQWDGFPASFSEVESYFEAEGLAPVGSTAAILVSHGVLREDLLEVDFGEVIALRLELWTTASYGAADGQMAFSDFAHTFEGFLDTDTPGVQFILVDQFGNPLVVPEPTMLSMLGALGVIALRRLRS